MASSKAGGTVAAVKAMEELREKMAKEQQVLEELRSQNESNRFVAKEIDRLEDDAVVFKLSGSVLVKEEREDAKETVEKRLEYIEAELKRHEAMHKDLAEQLKGIQMKVSGAALDTERLEVMSLDEK